MTEGVGEQAVQLQLKDADGRLYELRVQPSHQKFAPAASVIEQKEYWNEESSVTCTRCYKSFYNKTALRNHVKMQHVIELEDDELFAPDHAAPITPQTVPLKTDEEATPTLDPKRLVIASEDISYIIVKTIGGYTNQLAGKYQGPHNSETSEQQPPVNLTGPFECLQRSSFIQGSICHRVFFDCCEYSLHYRHEHTKRRKPGMRCQVCEKPLDGRRLGDGSTFHETTCTQCGMRFGDELALAQHKRVSHAKPKPFHCVVCLKRFTQQAGLMQHIRMHTGYRPFPCTICGKAFTQKAGLDQHLRIHTKIKPFRCVVCDKSFSQSIHLRQHMRTHTHIQPFQCGVCGRRFKQSSHLNFHVMSHELEDMQMIQGNGDMQQENTRPEERVQETIPIQITDN